MRHLLVLLCIWIAATLPALAQNADDSAILVADEVLITTDKVLVATGNVEVFQGQTSLTAKTITYDPVSETLIFEGPLVLRDGDGLTILASDAELSRDLRTGILRSAQLVLENQLQLAAVQLNRVDARYSQLYRAAVTSCRVCNSDRPPLWQIRAKRVVHDRERQQLYFDHAQLRIGPIPVFYLPRLRLPDPTLDRATGFLIPRLVNNTQLGTGIKIPYFIRLGDHKDLTLTPYVSSQTSTLELRYRQAFRRGRINVNGAFSEDQLDPTQKRYYSFADGVFSLNRGYTLTFDIEATSDDSYLSQYAYSFKDRLDSAITIERVRQDEYTRAGIIVYDSLRGGEIQSQLPTFVAEAQYERRFFPQRLGGEIQMDLEAHTHVRSSESTVSGEGRDVTRVQADFFWLKSWDLPLGIVADSRIGTAFEFFETRQDAVFAGTESRGLPQASFALRYPLSAVSKAGVTHFVEPVAQLAWTGDGPANLASDESGRVEFDEGNLLGLSRFPAVDRREHGPVVALGATWARYDPKGWETHFTFGQILREADIADFTPTSGLDGKRSDFLFAGQFRSQSGLAIAGRGLFDEDFNFSKAEFRADWSNAVASAGGSYVWLIEDAEEDRPRAVSELTMAGSYKVRKHWTFSGNWRYDLEDDRSAYAGLGIGYVNECVEADFTVNRRFASPSVVEPTTDFRFIISLRGFSAQTGNESHTRSCS